MRGCALRGEDGARNAVRTKINLLAGSSALSCDQERRHQVHQRLPHQPEELESRTTCSCAANLHGAATEATRRNVRGHTPCCNTERVKGVPAFASDSISKRNSNFLDDLCRVCLQQAVHKDQIFLSSVLTAMWPSESTLVWWLQ